MRTTHKERTLMYMQDFGSISSLEAFRDLGNTRLSATIWSLRHDDEIGIGSITEKRKNRWGDDTYFERYYLIGSDFEKHLKEEGLINE